MVDQKVVQFVLLNKCEKIFQTIKKLLNTTPILYQLVNVDDFIDFVMVHVWVYVDVGKEY